MIKIYDTQTLELGKPGENGAVRFRFDVEDWLSYGATGTFTLSHQRATDSYPYPIDVTLEDHYVIWVVSNIDNAVVGNGKAELIYSVGDTVIKSATMTTHTKSTLDEPDDTPDAYESWIQRLADIKEDIEGEAEYTQGLIDGIPSVVNQYILDHRDELKGDPGITTVDEETKQDIIADVIDTINVPSNLSELTDDLGSNPTHTHSQYLTQHQSLAAKQDTLVSGTNIKTIDGRAVIGSGDLGVRRPSGYAVTTGTDINTITTDGVYSLGSSTDYTYNHCPSLSGFAILFVEHATANSQTVLQTIVLNETGTTWRRQYNSGAWSDWHQSTGVASQSKPRYKQGNWWIREYSDGTVNMKAHIQMNATLNQGSASNNYRSAELVESIPIDLETIDSVTVSADIGNRAFCGVSLSYEHVEQIRYYLWSANQSLSNVETHVYIEVEGTLAQ